MYSMVNYDSMLVHRDKAAFYVTGQDGQGNVIAMGGGPVCDIHSSQYCGDRPGDVLPIWRISSWYQIRESSNQLWILIIQQ